MPLVPAAHMGFGIFKQNPLEVSQAKPVETVTFHLLIGILKGPTLTDYAVHGNHETSTI
jgi:hypothetical protein